ncbi:MAG: hypothetical protein K2I81_03080 [Alphaproteobacteria bacterium]|nr:hypothetical protein [Alphaproteobacteria bacterium]
MKKIIMIIGCCLISCGPVHASVVVCLKTGGQSCSGTSNDKSSWQQSCTDYSYVHGSATCAQPIAGQNVGASSFNVSVGTGSSSDNNRACFCRVLYPVVSNAYWAKTFSDVNECWINCSDVCANTNIFGSNSNFYFMS